MTPRTLIHAIPVLGDLDFFSASAILAEAVSPSKISCASVFSFPQDGTGFTVKYNPQHAEMVNVNSNSKDQSLRPKGGFLAFESSFSAKTVSVPAGCSCVSENRAVCSFSSNFFSQLSRGRLVSVSAGFGAPFSFSEIKSSFQIKISLNYTNLNC